MIHIKAYKTFKGITIGDNEFKVSQLSDGTINILLDITSVKHTVSSSDNIYDISVLKDQYGQNTWQLYWVFVTCRSYIRTKMDKCTITIIGVTLRNVGIRTIRATGWKWAYWSPGNHVLVAGERFG